MTNTTLTFQSTTFDVIDRNGQPWLTGLQVASALGYRNPNADSANLYTRHADEFTDAMTAVIKLPTAGGEQETRIFSPRGCHALGMFARTKVAKAFRVWVLDVLDREVSPPALPNPERKRLASTIASAIAYAAKKNVFAEVMVSDSTAWKHTRYLFCLTGLDSDQYHGYTKTLDDNVLIGTGAELAEWIAQPNHRVSDTELATLALACNQRLAQRLSPLPPLQGILPLKGGRNNSALLSK
jgi:prophage antirepressor-like protein